VTDDHPAAKEPTETAVGTYQVASIEVPATPRRQSGAVITAMDFALLKEGPPAKNFASRRDVCIGIAASAIVGVIGIVATGQYFTPGAAGVPPVPNWWAWIFTLVLLAGAAASFVIACFAHRDSANRAAAYDECVKSIDAQFTRPSG
jgi:hypothetical protein